MSAVRAGIVAAGLLLLALAGPARASLGEHGARLFDGRVAMPSQLVGRELKLPVSASRCSNCHHREGRPRDARATPIGPELGGSGLREMRPRRGGPPSAYDSASLCRLLRTGIDPAQVIIDTRMPRYSASESDCAALWAWLAGT